MAAHYDLYEKHESDPKTKLISGQWPCGMTSSRHPNKLYNFSLVQGWPLNHIHIFGIPHGRITKTWYMPGLPWQLARKKKVIIPMWLNVNTRDSLGPCLCLAPWALTKDIGYTLPVEKARWIYTNVTKYNMICKGVVKGKLWSVGSTEAPISWEGFIEDRIWAGPLRIGRIYKRERVGRIFPKRRMNE